MPMPMLMLMLMATTKTKTMRAPMAGFPLSSSRPSVLLLAALACLACLASASPPEQIVFNSASSAFVVPSNYKPTHQITNYLRSLDVTGAIIREQDVIKLKKSSAGHDWLLPMDERRASGLSFMEVLDGEAHKPGDKEKKSLTIVPKGFDSAKGMHYFAVKPMPSGDEIVLTINSHFLHAVSPKPDRLAQTNGLDQGLLWEGDLLGGFSTIPGAFSKEVEIKVKIKAPTPRIFKQIAPSGFDSQQAGGSNYVVFTNKVDGVKLLTQTQQASVHFHQPHPVMVIANLTRLVEVSHWGNNVAVEDQIQLENRGPQLKGSFSRFVHQSSLHTRAPGAIAHILTGLTLELPQGALSPYYIDTIGNVSTSHFRPSQLPETSGRRQSTKLKARKEAKSSKLELVPRYPIAGGWNYTFSIGFNLEAGRALRQQGENKYILKIPLFTNVVDVPIDLATLRVRLPEGSHDVQVFTPFPVDELKADLADKTYLDTTGHPTVFIRKLKCTEKHSGDVYISYTRAPVKSLQKPLAISAWMMLLFLVTAVWQRFDWKIGY